MSRQLITLTLALSCLAITAAVARAELSYSGDDLSAGEGDLVITNLSDVDGAELWKFTLNYRTHGALLVDFTDFTVGGGSFNYAGPGGLGVGMWNVGDNEGTFTEVTKTNEMYQFQLSGAAGDFGLETVFTINPADPDGTSWHAVRTITNNGASGVEPYGLADFSLNVNVDQYVSEDGGGDAILDGASGLADRIHGMDDGGGSVADPYLWKVNENIDRGAGGLDTAQVAQAKFTVLDNTYTQALSMMPDLTIEATSDIYPYYPSDNIGNVDLDGTPSYQARLYAAYRGREFMGTQRSDNKPLDPAESYEANYWLNVNISDGSDVILGDVDLNGIVDTADIDEFVQVLQGTLTDPDALAAADTDENTINDTADISPFITILQGGSADASEVPEPASIALLGLAGLAMLKRRR